MTSSVAGQQNSSTSLRPRPAMQRGANIQPMLDGGGSFWPSGTPTICNYRNRKLQQQHNKIKIKNITAASMGLIHLEKGSMNLSSALTTKTMEEWTSEWRHTKLGAAAGSAARCAFNGVLDAFRYVTMWECMCNNRLKSVELEKPKQQHLLEASELPK